MRYTFLSSHCVQGIALPAQEPDETLFEDVSQGIRVVLTADAVARLRILNRHAALMRMLLSARFHESVADDLPAILSSEIGKVERQRGEAIGADPVVLIEICGEIDASVREPLKEAQDFVVCFEAYDKKALRLSLQSKVSALLTALRTGTGDPIEFRHLVDGSYLIAEDGRVVHSANFEAGTMSAYSSRRLTNEMKEGLSRDMALALKSGPSLERVMRLNAQSLDRSTDNFRGFVAAWSSLEILIGKLFPTYQSLLLRELRSVNQSPGLHMYVDRIAAVMKDKHSLADKFAVLSVFLDDDQVAGELEGFRDLKAVRDKLSHGVDVDEAALPTRRVQQLFDKYLRNHLRRSP